MSTAPTTLVLGHVEQQFAIKTWRYLRLAMVALVFGLAVAVVFEAWKVDWRCTQTSISSYYYTPVRGYFVSALLAVGVCLYCLKGSTELEDVALNLAGLLAPVVALVPTPEHTGQQAACSSFPATALGRDQNVANNMTALIAVVVLALVAIAVLTLRSDPGERPPGVTGLVGYGLAVLLWVVVMVVFWGWRETFLDNAHYVAASLMFLCIIFVVGANAIGYQKTHGARSARNPYGGIAIVMIGAVVVCGGLGWFADWDHWILVLEATLIGAFALFWIIQTIELWNEGLRDPVASG